jgi:hypothetical protein
MRKNLRTNLQKPSAPSVARADLYLEFAEDCRTRALEFRAVPGKRDKLLAEAELWEQMARQWLGESEAAVPGAVHLRLRTVALHPAGP